MVEVLIFSIVILAIALASLIAINRNIKKTGELDFNQELLKQIKIIRKIRDVKERLDQTSNVAKNFLEKKFQIKKSLSYPEMETELIKKNKIKTALFCKDMGKTFYQTKSFDGNKVNNLITTLELIIREEILHEKNIKKND